MIDILVHIKRPVLAGNYAFSEKARIEMELDGLTELDVAESILNAVAVSKTIRSTSVSRKRAGGTPLRDSEHEPEWTSDLYER